LDTFLGCAFDSRVREDDRTASIQLIPYAFEVWMTQVFTVITCEQQDAVCVEVIEGVADFVDANLSVLEGGDGGEEAELLWV
jgi:hypothetical protein